MKVSVLLTCFKNDCIDISAESVLNQEEVDCELIVIGGRTSLKDDRIHIIDTSDKHFGKMNNLGIANARGDYISFLEEGNIMNPHILQQQYEICLSKNVDYIKSDYIANSDYHFISKHRSYGKFMDYELAKVSTEPFYRSGLYSKAFLLKNRICFSENILNDRQIYVFNYLIQFYAKSAYFLNEPLLKFEYNPLPRDEKCLKNFIAESKYLIKRFSYRNIKYEHIFYIMLWNSFCYEVIRVLRKVKRLSGDALCDITKMKDLLQFRFKNNAALLGRTGLLFDNRYLLLLNNAEDFLSYLGEADNAGNYDHFSLL